MSKKCINCNTIVEDNDKFCSYCGGMEFYNNTEMNETVVLSAANNPYQPLEYTQPTMQQDFTTPQSEQEILPTYQYDNYTSAADAKITKKKNHPILGAIKKFIIRVLMAGLVLYVVNLIPQIPKLLSEDYKKTADGVEFTVGTVKNGVYKNEWANLQFDVTDWPEADTATYEALKRRLNSEIVYYGYYSIDEIKGKVLGIYFEDLNKVKKKYNAEEYIQINADYVEDKLKNEGISYTISEIGEETILGEKYKCVTICLANGLQYEKMYARIYEGYIISFIISDTDETNIDNFIDSMEEYEK